MEENVLSEVRAVLRNNLGVFELEQVGLEDYLFEGDEWELKLKFNETNWDILLKKEVDEEMKTVGWEKAEGYKIPTVLKELIDNSTKDTS